MDNGEWIFGSEHDFLDEGEKVAGKLFEDLTFEIGNAVGDDSHDLGEPFRGRVTDFLRGFSEFVDLEE